MVNKYKQEILLNEYNVTNEKIEQFLRLQERLIYISLFFAFGSLKVTEEIEVADILYLLPLALAGLMSFILYYYRRNYLLQGYRSYLEDKINQQCEGDTIFYSKLVKKTGILSDINSVFIFLIFLALYFYLLITVYFKQLHLDGWIFWISACLHVVFLAGGVYSIVTLEKLRRNAIALSEKISKGEL